MFNLLILNFLTDLLKLICQISFFYFEKKTTFVALDRILQHVKFFDYVDIYGIVYEMRKERIAMVQNEQQYICIHECLLNTLEGKEDLYIEPQLLDNPGFDGELTF